MLTIAILGLKPLTNRLISHGENSNIVSNDANRFTQTCMKKVNLFLSKNYLKRASSLSNPLILPGLRFPMHNIPYCILTSCYNYILLMTIFNQMLCYIMLCYVMIHQAWWKISILSIYRNREAKLSPAIFYSWLYHELGNLITCPWNGK